jgi:hypothetical protein
VFRQHWRDSEFWKWWWQRRLSPKLGSAAAVGFCILLGGLGMYVADRLSSATAAGPASASAWRRTVERRVTVYTKPTPAGAVAAPVRVVTRKIVDYVPTTRLELRTRTAVVTTERVVTDKAVVTRTVIHKHTVTRSEPRLVTHTVTQSVTETAPPVTATETLPPITATQTLPPTTVIVTVTVTRGHGR